MADDREQPAAQPGAGQPERADAQQAAGSALPATDATAAKADRAFLQACVRQRFITAETVATALPALAKRRAEVGEVHPGEWLVENALLTPTQFRDVLVARGMEGLYCAACERHVDLLETTTGLRGLTCTCGSRMTPVRKAQRTPSAEGSSRRTAQKTRGMRRPNLDVIEEQSILLASDGDESTLVETAWLNESGRAPTRQMTIPDAAPSQFEDDADDFYEDDDATVGIGDSASTVQRNKTSRIQAHPEHPSAPPSGMALSVLEIGTDDILTGSQSFVNALRITRGLRAEYDLPVSDPYPAVKRGKESPELHRSPADVRYGYEGILRDVPDRPGEFQVLAHDRDLRRPVHMRLLQSGLEATNEQLERFLQEAQVLGQACHPGIVPILDVGMDELRRPFLTQPIIPGCSLASLLETRRREETKRKDDPKANKGKLPTRKALKALGISPNFWSDSPAVATGTLAKDVPDTRLTTLCAIITDIADVLVYAHGHGILHRDLHPGAIHIGRHGGVYLREWGKVGIAQRPDLDAEHLLITERSPDGKVFYADGTEVRALPYLAPERAEGALDQVGAHADVYGLAAVAFEVLFGVPPFPAETPAAMLGRIRTDTLNFPGTTAAGHPLPACRRVLDKALSRQPGQRFATMSEFRDAWRAALTQDRLVTAAPPEGARWWLRRAWHALIGRPALNLALVCAVAVLGVLTWQWLQPERVLLTSQPPGAQVWEGPRCLGVAPLTVEYSSSEPLQLELRLPGFAPLPVALSADDEALGDSLTMALLPIPVTVVATGEGSTARILNEHTGQVVAEGPLPLCCDLPPGEYRAVGMDALAPGSSTQFRLLPGDRPLHLHLALTWGTVRIEGPAHVLAVQLEHMERPDITAMATLIDGQATLQLRPGRYRVVLSPVDAMEPGMHSPEVTVIAGQTATCRIP